MYSAAVERSETIDSGQPAVNNKLQRLNAEPVFALLVVGCGGGPLESNLSQYLLKSLESDVLKDGCVALEGGSAIGAITRLVEDDLSSLRDFYQPPTKTKSGGTAVVDSQEAGRIAASIWESIKVFAITHSHADHIMGLIIASASSLSAKPLYGLGSTLKNLERIFDGGIWPQLAGWERDGMAVGRAYLYREIVLPCSIPLPLSEHLSLEAYPLSHGSISKHEHYESTAFFITDLISQKVFVFFGDVEPDSISKTSLNRNIWERAARLIVEEKLDTIFLECSYPSTQPIEALWGHLSPTFVMEELKVLAQLVDGIRPVAPPSSAAKKSLEGVNVVIIHIKDDVLPLPLPIPPPAPLSEVSQDALTMNTISIPPSPITQQFPAFPSSSVGCFPPGITPLSMSPPFPTINLSRRASGDQPSSSHFQPPNLISTGRSTWARNSTMTFSNNEGRRASCPGYSSAYLSSLLTSDHEGGLVGGRGRWKGTVLGTSDEDVSSSHDNLDNNGDSVRSVEDEPNEYAAGEEEEIEEGVEESVQERIERELNELEVEEGLGVRFVIAKQGMVIHF